MCLFDIHCRGHLSNFITPSIILEINAKRLKSIVMSLSIFASFFPSFVTFLFASKIFFQKHRKSFKKKWNTNKTHSHFVSISFMTENIKGVKNINRHSSNSNKLQQTINKWAELKNNKEVRDSKLVCVSMREMQKCTEVWKGFFFECVNFSCFLLLMNQVKRFKIEETAWKIENYFLD